MSTDTPRCGAKSRRTGKPCANRRGQRTPHEGIGRCWLHGGLTPIKSGRYSQVMRTTLGEMLAEHARESIGRAEVSELVAALYEVAVKHVTTERRRATLRSEWEAAVARVAPGVTLPGFLTPSPPAEGPA